MPAAPIEMVKSCGGIQESGLAAARDEAAPADRSVEFGGADSASLVALQQGVRREGCGSMERLRHAGDRQRAGRAARRDAVGQARQVGAGRRQAAGGSAASRCTPAPSRRRRCARPCSTSRAGASAASTAAATGSSRTSRSSDLVQRLQQDARPRGRGAAAPVHAQHGAQSACAEARFIDAEHGRADHRRRRASARPASTNALIAVGTRPHRPANVPFDRQAHLRQRRDAGARAACRAR